MDSHPQISLSCCRVVFIIMPLDLILLQTVLRMLLLNDECTRDVINVHSLDNEVSLRL